MVTKQTSGKKIALYTIIAVCFVALLGLMIFNTLKLNGLRSDLDSTEANSVNTQNSLTETNVTLSLTELDLVQAQSDLSVNQVNLADKQNELLDAIEYLENTKSSLADTLKKYSDTVATTDAEKVVNTGLHAQYSSLLTTYSAQTSGYDYALRDPTYEEVKAFLAVDTTNLKPYIVGQYVCENFAAEVSFNAQQQKIRAGCVQLHMVGLPHTLIAFNTTDKGIVYFDPQTDEEVILQIGKHYWTECVVAPKGKYSIPTDYDDTVKSFYVIW
jgi:hypothetical protein